MTDKKQVKVFQMNDCDWYVGATAEECVKKIIQDTESNDIVDDGYPIELSDEEMNSIMFTHLNYGDRPDYKITFAERLKEMIEEKADFPCVFATTEY